MAKAESAMRSGDKVPLVGSALDGGANLLGRDQHERWSPR